MELKNSEHYNDPTPYEAHKNIRKEEQLEAARMRTISVGRRTEAGSRSRRV